MHPSVCTCRAEQWAPACEKLGVPDITAADAQAAQQDASAAGAGGSGDDDSGGASRPRALQRHPSNGSGDASAALSSPAPAPAAPQQQHSSGGPMEALQAAPPPPPQQKRSRGGASSARAAAARGAAEGSSGGAATAGAPARVRGAAPASSVDRGTAAMVQAMAAALPGTGVGVSAEHQRVRGPRGGAGGDWSLPTAVLEVRLCAALCSLLLFAMHEKSMGCGAAEPRLARFAAASRRVCVSCVYARSRGTPGSSWSGAPTPSTPRGWSGSSPWTTFRCAGGTPARHAPLATSGQPRRGGTAPLRGHVFLPRELVQPGKARQETRRFRPPLGGGGGAETPPLCGAALRPARRADAGAHLGPTGARRTAGARLRVPLRRPLPRLPLVPPEPPGCALEPPQPLRGGRLRRHARRGHAPAGRRAGRHLHLPPQREQLHGRAGAGGARGARPPARGACGRHAPAAHPGAAPPSPSGCACLALCAAPSCAPARCVPPSA